MDTTNYIVNKFKINIGREYFIDIPQMKGSVDLAKLFADLKYSVGAEIGTDEGEYAQVLLNTIPSLKLHCIDPWTANAYVKGEQPEGKEEQIYFDERFYKTQERLNEYDNVIIHRKTSMEALKDIENGSLDFVYIDGNHDFLNVTQDIHFWKAKVRSGGIISGHDYCKYPFHKYNHVKKVVQAYATSYNMLPVFAVSHTKEGLKRDRFRSWFIVKK